MVVKSYLHGLVATVSLMLASSSGAQAACEKVIEGNNGTTTFFSVRDLGNGYVAQPEKSASPGVAIYSCDATVTVWAKCETMEMDACADAMLMGDPDTLVRALREPTPFIDFVALTEIGKQVAGLARIENEKWKGLFVSVSPSVAADIQCPCQKFYPGSEGAK
jgi:hypothetical protein